MILPHMMMMTITVMIIKLPLNYLPIEITVVMLMSIHSLTHLCRIQICPLTQLKIIITSLQYFITRRKGLFTLAAFSHAHPHCRLSSRITFFFTINQSTNKIIPTCITSQWWCLRSYTQWGWKLISLTVQLLKEITSVLTVRHCWIPLGVITVPQHLVTLMIHHHHYNQLMINV